MKSNIRFVRSRVLWILVAATCTTSCGTREKTPSREIEPVPVTVGTATLESFSNISMSGHVIAKETAFISTRIMGFISSIKVQPGDYVSKGQLMVTISNDDILAKRAQAAAMVTESQATLTDAERDHERFKELLNQHSASEKEFENASLRYESVKARADAALQMHAEADAMLAYTNLVAPFSGVVTQKNNHEGTMAIPGMPILTLEKSAAHDVVASITENEIGLLKPGMRAEVIVKSTGKKFGGEITEISPSSQFNGGHYQVRISLSPSGPKSGLFSGMSVHVDVPLTGNGDEKTMVPTAALVRKDQLVGLYTVTKDRTAHLRWLKIGKEFGSKVEVLSGLSAGETFITASEGRLFNGTSITTKK